MIMPSPTRNAPRVRSLGVETTFMGIGVDRIDYTKGILERFLAIERFLEKVSQLSGEIHVCADQRPVAHIKRYHDLLAEVEAGRNELIGAFREASGSPSCF